MQRFAEWLETHGAHHDVVEWARNYDDAALAWAECPRGDWLLGIAARVDVDRAALVAAAAACARIALDQVPDDEASVLGAIEAAERWAAGKDDAAARGVVQAALEQAIERAPDPAVHAAGLAALACLHSIDDPGEAAGAAAFAVQASVLDVGECAVMSAMGYAQATSANRARKHVPFEHVRERLAASRPQ